MEGLHSLDPILGRSVQKAKQLVSFTFEPLGAVRVHRTSTISDAPLIVAQRVFPTADSFYWLGMDRDRGRSWKSCRRGLL